MSYSAEINPLELNKSAKTGEDIWQAIANILELQNQAPILQPVSRDDDLPLSFSQERLWFIHQLQPNSSTYNVSFAFRLQGLLNISALERSFNEIIQRHEALRTRFFAADNQPVQVIAPSFNLKLPVINLQQLSQQEKETQVLQLIKNEVQQPFDLEQNSLLRCYLLQLGSNEYVLLLSVHHIAFDGWSEGVFWRELTALYTAFAAGKPSPLPELPIQYADFAVWQRKWLQGQVTDTQLNYWKRQLADAPPLLELPTDRVRPPVQTNRGSILHFRLDEQLTQKLKSLSEKSGATLFMTLLTGFVILLSRYSNQQDILVGSPIANRNRSEIESLIGFFVNILVLRTDVSGNPTFWELLQRVRQVAIEAYAHQDVPFEQVVEALQPERNLNYSRLFQVMFVLLNTPPGKLELPGLSLTQLEIENPTAKFDITLLMTETEQGLTASLEYNSDLFEPATITRMAGHLQTLLERIVSNPEEKIWQLPLLTQPEQQQLLTQWNDTKANYPADKCIHQLFEEQVQRTPDAVAVVYEKQKLTYQQLNTRANQLARYLQSLGVGADTLVGLCVERSIEMLVGLLGILKAGGAYVPLDPDYPTDRLSYMLDDSKVSVLLTQEKLLADLPEHHARVVCLDRDWHSISRESQENPVSNATRENLAYVIYTSGSTGKPKGTLVNHYNVVRLFAATDDWYHFNQDDVWTMFHSYAFDFSVWEIWGALLYGGRLVIVPYLVTRSPESFYQLLVTEKVTILNQTPSAFRQLIQAENSGVTTGELNLRLVIFGGEALEIQSLQPWFERHGDIKPQLVNMYGITETTVHVTYRPLSKADLHSTASVIGRPIPDLQVYVLDEYQQPVPIGVPGEMYVGGAGVTRGYLNREQLTAERFISHPWNNSKLYKTGDLARYLPNGDLEYLGRIDQQVKIRGFRIELGEIEALLASHPDIWESVVLVREDEPGDKRLVAYIVAKEKSSKNLISQTPTLCASASLRETNIIPPISNAKSPTATELRQYLKAKLPEYMVPSAFVMLESLPLTSNGKIDRKALPAPESYSASTKKYIAPRNPIEELLAQIWSQVLKLEQVGIDDNFFELGGHSLLATQLLSRIRTSFKLELPLRELFATTTLAELARAIEQLQQQDLEISATPILPRAKNADLPLSFAQQRLWFLDQLEPNSAFYNIPTALRLVGNLNQEALEQSLQEIIHRHEALRTNFITIDGQPTQVIQTQINWTFSIVDFQDLPATQQEIATQQLAQKQLIQPFDLATEALVRATLVVLNDTEHILLVFMHHVVSDGWSMGVFISELTALYNAYSQGQLSLLAPLPIQYADFAIWQRQWLQGDVLQSQLSYWQQQLKHAPTVLSLPTDRPRPAVQTFTGVRQKFTLSVDLTEKLLKLSQEQGCTLFMTLLAAYDTLLYRYTGQSDILVGTPIANRDRSEIEGLIGFFVNTLVMRSNLAGNPSFSELLNRVRETAMGAYTHQNLPFEMLVEALQPERDLAHTPLFQVMFVLENAPMSPVELTNLSFNPLIVETTISKFDLTLLMENTTQGLVGWWEYNTDLFDASTIDRMTGHFVTLLEGIVANPEAQISQLPLLTEVEQHQLLVEWNNTQADYPLDKSVHQLFEEQVERTPDAVAVVFDNQQLTYQQLNCRANQLAHYLRSLGVTPDTLVGICVERSLEMVVGILGILKASGAYLPLDLEYPTERLRFMLKDTQLSVLLTQAKLINKLPEHQAHKVCLDTDWQEISQLNQDNPITNVQVSNLAYVIYTSGSTGQPKGVLVKHESLLNLIFWHQRTFEITPLDKATQLAGTAFDAAVWELWPYLTAGASIYLVTSETLLSPIDLQNWLTSNEITISFLPTPLAEKLLSLKWNESTALRTMLVGGDKLHNYPSAFIPFEVVNNYGPTENTVVTTSGLVVSHGQNTLSSPSIGRPIANTKTYILDSNLQPVPIGVPGELYIGGASLAKGYLNRPELTQERFIPNPFNNSKFKIPFGNAKGEQNSKLYKTGDLVRYLADGNIEYLGRIDNQVKIRGFRIELGEIEAALSQHSDIQSCCVICREDNLGEQRLVAYLVANQESTPTISELRQYLKAKLPDYMVPSAFVLLESLPLTPNGKVDRKVLLATELYSSNLDKYVAPRNPIEELLVQIWSQVLKVKSVGIADNFFELGGHSLLATQLISRIRNIFKVELPLRELFATATLAELAQAIEQLQQQNIELSASPILPRAKNADLPLSFAQQRLWFLDQLEPHSALYNIPVALRLVGNLNQTALEQSLIEIIHRHEVLRTNFTTIDGQATQIIREQGTGNREQGIISIVDFNALSATQKEVATQQLAQQQAIAPFDLATEALIRVTLLALNETEHILLVCMHHIVSDGWSMSVFISELAQLYNAYSQGQPSPLVPLTIQYADFAIWQRNWLQGDVLQSQLSYWEQQLANAPALLALPTDRPRPAVQTFVGAHLEFTLSVELTDKLVKLSQEHGCTLFMTLLAAYDTLLYRYTGQSDILVGTPIANRDRSEIEGLIGFFVNTLVMRSNLAGNPSFSELLTRVRETAMDAYTHQNLPFEMLVEALQPERDLGHTPLFQVVFMLQNAPVQELELAGLTVSALPVETKTAKVDLALSMENTTQGLVGVWEYNTDLFDASTIERMTGHFVTLLEGIVANPEQKIAQLPLLTQHEQHQLLIEWNDTQANYPQYKCIHQLFEERVNQTPNAVAVVFAEQKLTYQQLNIRANQLADYLQSLGVKPDTLVGICVERSLEMVVGLLGVLKAGGAYLPLDPEYPTERLRFMLEDAQVSVLLTQQRLIERLPEYQANLVCLDEVWEQIAQNNQDNLNSEVRAFNLANLIYTSGSTGRPKGVMVEHKGLCNLAQAQIQTFGVNSDSRILQFASFSFDASIWEIIMALGSGGMLYLGTKDSLLPGKPLVEQLRKHSITHVTLPPSALAVMPSDELPALQTIIVAGEACSPELIKQWSVGRNFFNAYGPTEATVCATIAKCTEDEKITIGKAIANTQIHILDEYLQPVPVGVPGELHIGGVSLARGYLNRPDLTQEKFIPNPFEKAEGSRLYKTGDLGRYLPDGTIDYLGRIDHQVKIRGFRIELGEIEAALSQHNDVQICCVIPREETGGNKRLVAYVGTQKNVTITTGELRQFLADKLPGYMLPSAFVILESLPLTPNGKVDRRALPNPDLHQELSNYVMPNTEIENIIAGIWQQALAIEKVGIYNNFFELGGHSLLLVSINQQLQEKFGIELSIVDMFNYPTIHSFSQYLNNKINQEETTKQNHNRTQAYSELKSLKNQRLQSRQQYRSQRKR
ncbi:amino acid adenylation domain-containing protein [Tolypothrix sp. PCC 7910]|nr:non-ribosomal peptide synthetase [Tolypothrix sp. PCC 7910]QIR37151.1 amino acid adenylation domain-containing protein [Tolypothrix sp. PCC 7910]